MFQVVEIEAGVDALEPITRFVLTEPSLEGTTTLRSSPTSLSVRARAPVSGTCREILSSEATCVSCRFLRPYGDVREGTWPLIVPQGPVARALMERLSRVEGERLPGVLRARAHRPTAALTPRQTLAVRAACRLGYYTFPRRASLGDVAASLGVGRSAASELLRRAEGKLLERSDTDRSVP